jgi:hypothetical protein
MEASTLSLPVSQSIHEASASELARCRLQVGGLRPIFGGVSPSWRASCLGEGPSLGSLRRCGLANKRKSARAFSEIYTSSNLTAFFTAFDCI